MLSNTYEFYDERKEDCDGAGGWIQWKGTDVCVDLHCVCGHDDHHDGDFFYHWQCPECGVVYSVCGDIKLQVASRRQSE